MTAFKLRQLGIRFAIVFFPLFVFLEPNGFIPNTDNIYNWYIHPFHVFIPWVGAHILHLSYPIIYFTYGSGDTTYDWIILAMTFLVALIAMIIWSILVRRRNPDHNVAWRWLLILIRYYVAFTMISYGFAKVFHLQFPFPSAGRLQQSFGNASPMGLAWTFFGYSTGYNIFTGMAEVIAGVLLMSRRTVRIGAILSLVVMGNIMAINYAYDVCVKLMSTMLVIMSIILVIRDWQPHYDFFIGNRHAGSDDESSPRFEKRGLNIAKILFKYALIIYVFGGVLWTVNKYNKEYGQDPPLYGLYDIQRFVRGSDTLAPLLTDTTRWRKLTVGRYGYASVRMMNDSTRLYNFQPDTVKHQVVMYTDEDTLHKYRLAYERIGVDSFTIRGRFNNDSVTVAMKKFDDKKFILVSRGFHWINETPYNR